MRVIRRLCNAGVAATVLATTACSYTLDATQLGVPASLAESATAQPQGTPFRVTRHPVYLLWGAFQAGSPNLEDVLAGQIGTGTAVTNVRVRVRSRPLDLLVTGLTLGLIAPRSVTIEGVVVTR